ncbi:MAG: 16S rRNA (uracil(1498)-N(3))-methyltransferase [Halioglobus sp.]|nr:16S rRNA (uracil(1498)-N(3))-methyltransferase [Halioglobus sp.]
MNLLLFSHKDRVGTTRIVLRDHRLQHLQRVQRTQVDDTLRVGEIGGQVGSGKVLEINRRQAVLEIELRESPPPKLAITLVIALPRPKMLRRILRSATECGVSAIHLINSYRVEKSFWHSPLLADDAIENCLLQGLAQSRDTQFPQVERHRRFKPFVEDTLPALATGKHALLVHPGDYPPCPASVDDPVLLVIGPEGGFIPYEVAHLRASGCMPVTLGLRILRVETAVSAVLGRLRPAQ